jgi:hypothetical protein
MREKLPASIIPTFDIVYALLAQLDRLLGWTVEDGTKFDLKFQVTYRRGPAERTVNAIT